MTSKPRRPPEPPKAQGPRKRAVHERQQEYPADPAFSVCFGRGAPLLTEELVRALRDRSTDANDTIFRTWGRNTAHDGEEVDDGT